MIVDWCKGSRTPVRLCWSTTLVLIVDGCTRLSTSGGGWVVSCVVTMVQSLVRSVFRQTYSDSLLQGGVMVKVPLSVLSTKDTESHCDTRHLSDVTRRLDSHCSGPCPYTIPLSSTRTGRSYTSVTSGEREASLESNGVFLEGGDNPDHGHE